MNYCLYKLSFDAPVHFGPSDSALSLLSSRENFCADTLFSALCHSALSLGGAQRAKELCAWAHSGELLLSDGLIWAGEHYYLPKPCASGEFTQEVSTRQRKAMKALKWISVADFPKFTASLHGGTPYNALESGVRPGSPMEVERARIGRQGEDTMPYYVGAYIFDENAGLYILAGCKAQEQQDTLDELLTGLGYSGIGGKVSSGYGKFHIERKAPLSARSSGEELWLYRALTAENTKKHLLLTTSLPKEEELDDAMEGASCQVVRRGGFVQSEQYAQTAQKKATQYFLAAGAVLTKRFDGDLYEVGNGGSHPVYRYSKPVFLGVEL